MTVFTSRQADMIEVPGRFGITLFGAGATGSTSFYTLASMGIRNWNIIDGDVVNYENMMPAHFSSRYLGMPKAEALRRSWFERHNNPPLGFPELDDEDQDYLDGYRIETVNRKISRSDFGISREHRYVWETSVAIIAFDGLRQMKMAALIAESAEVDLVINPRIGGASGEVWAYAPSDSKRKREFHESLSGEGTPLTCGEKSTAPLTKGFISGMVAQCVWSLINEITVPSWQMYDLRNGKFIRIADDPEPKLVEI